MSAVLSFPKQRWTHACSKHEGSGQFCKVCGFRDWLHRVKKVQCSSCGGAFLRRDGYEGGFSQCSDHKAVL